MSACGTSLARPNGLSHRSAGVLVHAAAGVPVRLSPSMSAWYSSRSDSSNLGGPGRAAPRKEVAAPVERLLSCEIALSWLGGDVRNRYYDAEIGRYISRDPLGYPNGLNNYLYVNNNPINRVDPLGLGWGFDLLDAVLGAAETVANVGMGVADGVGFGLASTAAGIVYGDDVVADIQQSGGYTVGEVASYIDPKNASKKLLTATGRALIEYGTDQAKVAVADSLGEATGTDLGLLADAAGLARSGKSGSGPSANTHAAAAVHPEGPVKPGDKATYGELKDQKRKNGETESLDMDHRPSLAAQVAAAEDIKGKALTKQEIAKLKRDSPAVATPRADHRAMSRTYGARNTKAKVDMDKKDLAAARRRDNAAYKKKKK